MKQRISKTVKKARRENGMIHCITNPISINQCANAVLAVGCRPMMAEHPDEAAEITKTAQALLLNIGNITDARMKSIRISSVTANRKNIPSVLDTVGVACSMLRKDYIKSLTDIAKFSVIKGNYSEIEALADAEYTSQGVDAQQQLTAEHITASAVKAAKKYGAVILASGKTDIVTDGKRVAYIKNGTQQLAQVTGTGCMLGALCACYLSVTDSFTAAVSACTVMGLCGQLSCTEKGSGTFMVNLMDSLCSVSGEDIEKSADVEMIEIEKV